MKQISTIKQILALLLVLTSGFSFAAAPAYVPSSGLQAWYPFDGSANNTHSSLFNGTVNGAQLTTDRFGTSSSAYLFDGIDDYINLGSSILSSATTASVACWVQTSQFSTAQNIWQKRRQSNGAGFYLGTENGIMFGGLNREPAVSAIPFYTPFTSFSNTSWTHIVFNNNNGALTLYVNGVLFSQVTLPQGALVGTMPFYLGKGFDMAPDAFGNRAFAGKIDDVGIWNRVLTTQEISALYNATDRTRYYSKSTGSINQLSTWGTNTDGTGTSPLSFDSSNTVYNVVNGNTSLNGNFRVGGTNSVVVFGNGVGIFNFPIASTDTISSDSIFLHNSGTLTVSGTLQSNKLGAGTSSAVQYIGATPQLIAGGTYENIAVASSTKIASGNINVRGVLGMATSINCNGYELTLGINTTTRGSLNRTSGNIIGKFSRWYTNATNSGTTGLFPLGTETKYTPIQIEFTTAPFIGGKLTCEFIAGAPGNVGLPQFDFSNGFVFIDKAASEGVIRLISSGILGGTFTATYTANNYTGVTNYSNLRLIHRYIGGNWNLSGNAGINTGTNTAAVISRSGLDSLSGEFGIGGDQMENPLPVKLTTLQARLINDNSTQIKWQTAFEYNAAKFVVQRSTDKLKWITRGEVKSQGNSTITTSYHFNDDVSGLNNVVYYRLVQADLDGASTISKVVSVALSKQVIAALQVYPNPANDKFVVSGLTGKAQVYDITGKQQLEITADGEVNISHLPDGIYFLRNINETIKIIKY
jgi:hypothetical protein